ncbi:MAG: hypothetical protein BGO51_02875 [Rhodospirillales bacterium 69-11]|nr:MAG: hypothetical protein ABS99_08895 [Acetobacteraceae bacterium SCN 69-10]OJW31003.1 MAG: hypothetical protein BGO51_02875 [Rhodospirillales bacterium 69-11]
MRTMQVILHELAGLFIDDGSLAVALLVWCAIVGGAVVIAPRLPATVSGPALALGCVAILWANVGRAAKLRAAGR